MNRKDFIRNSLGSLAAVMIGSKLDWLPIPNSNSTEPILYIAKGSLKKMDVIRCAEGRVWLVTSLFRSGEFAEGEVACVNENIRLKIKEVEGKGNAVVFSSCFGER